MFNSGRLIVEHCTIENFTTYGIGNNTTQATSLSVRDTTFDNIGTVGIYSKTTTGTNAVTVTHSAFFGGGGGVWASANSDIQVNDSTFANINGAGIYADPQGGANALISVQHSVSSRNQNGIYAQYGRGDQSW